MECCITVAYLAQEIGWEVRYCVIQFVSVVKIILFVKVVQVILHLLPTLFHLLRHKSKVKTTLLQNKKFLSLYAVHHQ
jgi:hypothetical protein